MEPFTEPTYVRLWREGWYEHLVLPPMRGETFVIISQGYLDITKLSWKKLLDLSPRIIPDVPIKRVAMRIWSRVEQYKRMGVGCPHFEIKRLFELRGLL